MEGHSTSSPPNSVSLSFRWRHLHQVKT